LALNRAQQRQEDDHMNTAEKYAYEAKQLLAQADLEGRDLTPDERGQFETALAKSRQAREAEGDGKAQAERIGRMIGGDDISASGQPTGWAGVANAIANKKQYSVEVPTEGLVGKAAPARGKSLTANDLDEGAPFQIPGFMPLGADRRFLYPLLNRTVVTTELSASDFRQEGSRAIDGSGEVERELTGTTEKAELDLEVSFINEPLKQVAVVIKDVPNALVDASGALQAFLSSEGQYQLDRAIDSHVLASIEGVEFLANQEGSTQVEQIRRAIGDHRAAGYNPTVLAADPTTAADLDLFATGADNAFSFPLGSYGASSPLFGLTVAENAGVTDMTLIDPLAVGTLCLGPTAIEVDRSQGFTKNTSIVRLEASVLMVVRNPEGIYVITSS
jgi:hypothetical protein